MLYPSANQPCFAILFELGTAITWCSNRAWISVSSNTRMMFVKLAEDVEYWTVGKSASDNAWWTSQFCTKFYYKPLLGFILFLRGKPTQTSGVLWLLQVLFHYTESEIVFELWLIWVTIQYKNSLSMILADTFRVSIIDVWALLLPMELCLKDHPYI